MLEISLTKRILLLRAHGSRVLDLVKDLTGSAPEPNENDSVAGLIHDWDVTTKYYHAKIPIWIDEISDLEAWKETFMQPEAKEVVEAIGGWIYCFSMQADGQIPDDAKKAMEAIQEIMGKKPDGDFDEDDLDGDEDLDAEQFAIKLAVAMPAEKKAGSHNPKAEDYERQEDDCLRYGFEYIAYGDMGISELGDKVGLERLREAMEANEDWEMDSLETGGLPDEFRFDAEDDTSAIDRAEAEWTNELYGVKAALHEDAAEASAEEASEQATQVDNLDGVLGKLLTLKEHNASLPEKERKKRAAQAVQQIMKDHPNI